MTTPPPTDPGTVRGPRPERCQGSDPIRLLRLWLEDLALDTRT